MVLNITVKTLDSQNYQFEAEDGWTVQQFKKHIQPTVSVSSDEQRLIFCGRVLQDDKKLIDYDCSGKVIHLVRRPPPPLDNPDQGSSAADSNNNNNNNNNVHPDEANFGGTQFTIRWRDEPSVLLSAMSLGPEANMNHILRHILTLQQAVYARTLGGGPTAGTSVEPMSMTDIDRHLHNATRLLRITANTINECMARIAALSPSGARPTADRSNQEVPRPVITAASSHTDLQRDDEMQTNDNDQEPRASTSAPDATVDDMGVGAPSQSASQRLRPSIPRQSLTTDDLPQSNTRPVQRLVPVTVLRSRNENRLAPLSLRQRGESELDRYLTILNYSSDLQNQFQGLTNRYRQLIDMSRRGGLIVPQATTSTATGTESNSGIPTANQSSQSTQPGQMSSSLMNEARILGSYVPIIMHHISHLQHALSDFTVDFRCGRLLCVSTNARAGQRVPQFARRSNPPVYDVPTTQSTNSPGAQANTESVNQQQHQPNPRRDTSQPNSTLEGSVTITATTVETTPIISTSTSTLHPQANATIVVTAQPDQPGMRIPISIPLSLGSHGSVSMDFTANQASSAARGSNTASAQEGNQQQSTQQTRTNQQPRANQQATTSNSTQTGPRPIGVISGRIPLPFDYFLPCFSPWANHSVTNRPPPSTRPAQDQPLQALVQWTTSEQQSAANGRANSVNIEARANGASSATPLQTSRNLPTAPVLDMGLTEVVSNIVGSILRAPQRDQNLQQGGTAGSHPNHDPLLNIIPELALNAASQILGGVLGLPTGNQQAGTSQQQQTSSTSGTAVMMDIDIDDSSSSQSESRYQDARESNSPVATASSIQSTSRPSSSHSIPSQSARSRGSTSANPNMRYDRQQLVEVMQNHPDWIPIIEADIGVMEQHQRAGNNNQPFFSDAYLSSIPRKRRRLLTANPDRVLILQPSPSRAITNLLRRAIVNSSSSNIESLDQVLDRISSDSDLQSAYEDYIKTAVEMRLRTDYDYCPQKFENSSKYFK